MTPVSNCPACGSALVPAESAALCPRCLLLAGLGPGRPDPPVDPGDPTVLGVAVRRPGPTQRAAPPAGACDDDTREVVGRTIGRYKLLEEIGEGGFGVVYLAEQNEPVRRKVALKVLKPGMDTREIVSRFGTERRALALMDHPNIARVHDGGSTAGGRPYFVMEWVRGVPLTGYCDEHRLNLRQRLALFRDVLSAVQHAHQKGIIHRDLKPSNILVATHDGKPVIKVIDFGIAKALGSELAGGTSFTRIGHLIGTPEYMSPEQAGPVAIDVDTRSDVYSAGVVLYELLIGHTPISASHLRSSSHAEMQRLISESEPPPPSVRFAGLGEGRLEVACRRDTEPARLAREVRGDLDWIVMKALEKDRTRRYATAAGLSADLHRYLEDEPVSARPPGMGYRFGKFARRNKAGLAVAALISVILVAATVVSVYEAFEARKMLRQASLSEARALRLSGEGGRRFDALKSLGIAAAIKKGADVLDEFVSVLGVADLRPWESWASPARLYDLAAVAPDFASHAVGAPDGTVTVRSLAPTTTTKPGDRRPSPESPPPVLAVLPGKGVPVNWLLRYSPDSRLLVVGRAGNDASSVQATLWDWKANTVLGSIDGISRRAADFSPDSTVLAAAVGPTLALFDSRTGRRLREWPGPTGTPYGLRFRPDGKAVAVSSLDDGTVSVVDLEGGRVLATRGFNSPRGIDWHRDNRRLAVACVGGIVVWHTTVPEQTKTIARAPGSTIDRVAWSHSTELLASSGWQQPVTLHDGALGQSLVVANGEVKDLRFSPAGRQAERAPDTRLGLLWKEGTLGLMEVADGGMARHAAGEAHQEALRNTAWHPNGGVLATVSDHTVRFWNKELRDLGGLRVEHGRFAAFTPHGLILVASTIQRRACTLEGSPPVLRLGRPEMLDPRAGWDHASTTADGSLLAAAGHDRAVVIDLSGRRPPREIGDHAKASQVALNPAGEWLATGTYYGTGVKVWSVAAGGLVHEFPGYDRCSLGFSPKGEWLVVGTGSRYDFYRAGTWQLEHSLSCSTVEDPGWLAWSPPSRNTVFALEPEDFSLSMHYVRDFKLFARPQFERQRPLSFHPGGALLLTTDPDHRIHLWNLFLVRKTLDNFGLDLKDQSGQVLRALPNPAELPLVESSEFEESVSAAR